jgi:hypothetical protein
VYPYSRVTSEGAWGSLFSQAQELRSEALPEQVGGARNSSAAGGGGERGGGGGGGGGGGSGSGVGAGGGGGDGKVPAWMKGK